MAFNNHTNRRNFIKKASLGAVVPLGISDLITSVFEAEKVNKITLNKGDVILFQGDSITDADRKKEEKNPNNNSAMGSGYAFLAASELLHKHADKNLQIYNKGISGNKVYQLAERWESDALELKPAVLSILIGVNDFWHMLNGNYTGTLKVYQDDFKALLDRTKQKLPDVKLIIGEPFGVAGIKAVDQKWYPAFTDYQKAAREIAKSYNAVLIPYQSVFDKAQKLAPGVYWTYDGVHTSMAGAELMAKAWLEAIHG